MEEVRYSGTMQIDLLNILEDKSTSVTFNFDNSEHREVMNTINTILENIGKDFVFLNIGSLNSIAINLKNFDRCDIDTNKLKRVSNESTPATNN